MATSLKDTIRQTEMNSIVTSAGNAAKLLIYSGTPPTKTNAPSGTLGVTLPLSNPIGVTAANGLLTISGTPITNTCVASITPGYYRVIDGATDDGTHTQIQGTCDANGIVWSSALSNNGNATLSSLTYTEGNS